MSASAPINDYFLTRDFIALTESPVPRATCLTGRPCLSSDRAVFISSLGTGPQKGRQVSDCIVNVLARKLVPKALVRKQIIFFEIFEDGEMTAPGGFPLGGE